VRLIEQTRHLAPLYEGAQGGFLDCPRVARKAPSHNCLWPTRPSGQKSLDRHSGSTPVPPNTSTLNWLVRLIFC